MSNSHEDIRREQNQYGRRTLHAVNRGDGKSGNGDRPRYDNEGKTSYKPQARKPAKPKGHDAILADLQESGVTVAFFFPGDVEALTGVIKARDKFTITIVTPSGVETIYKHSLRSFRVSVEALEQAVA